MTTDYTHLIAPDELYQSGYVDPEDHEGESGYDGRLLRGERSKVHIAEAMIELIEEGNSKPTARLIAERAGVSLRLVFHHFDDLEAVFQKAAMIQAGRHWRKVVTIPPTGSTAERIEATVRQRRQLYVAITPVRQVANVKAVDDGYLQQLMAAGRRRLRMELATTFEPELQRAGDDAGMLLDAVEAVSNWEWWNAVRTARRKSAIATQRLMQFSLTALLG
jgi:TetR/AcrR family transcriptional regulator, regulator of autoinduction and epiphytic fitness